MESRDFDLSNLKNISDLAGPVGNLPASRVADRVRIGISPKTRTKGRPSIRIVVGKDVAKGLHWIAGDRVDFLFNNSVMMLKRSPSGRYVLGHANKESKHCYTVTPTIFDGMPLSGIRTRISSHEPDWRVVEDSLLIKWPHHGEAA